MPDSTNMTTSQTSYQSYDDMVSGSAYTLVPLVSGDEDHVGRNLYRIQETDEIVCHVPSLSRWSEDIAAYETSDDGDAHPNNLEKEPLGISAATLLAIHHFNSGDNTIVQELTEVHESCPIRFTTDLIDTESSVGTTMRLVNSFLNRPPNGNELQPCAFLGSSWSSVTERITSFAGSFDVPTTTSAASAVTLNDSNLNTMFSRTIPSDSSLAQMTVYYLAKELEVSEAAVFFVDNSYGGSYSAEMFGWSHRYQMKLSPQPFDEGADDRSLRSSLEKLKEKGYRYIIGVFLPEDYQRIMTTAMELGIAGTGHLWIFNSAMAPLFLDGNYLELDQDSALYEATLGNAIVTDVAGIASKDTGYDNFRAEWHNMATNDDFIEYLTSKLPDVENTTTPYLPEFFADNEPTSVAAYTYDAIINLGLSACQALEESGQIDIFSGYEHQQKLVEGKFLGASGNVTIDRQNYSRVSESTYHVVYNILPENQLESGDNVTLSGSPFSFYSPSQQNWQAYSDETGEFIFPGGSTVQPIEIPHLWANYNYVTASVRGVAFALSGMAILLSVGFFVYACILRRTHRVISTSQPFFLGLICLGTLLMAASIIAVAIDDGIASDRVCDVACSLQFWLMPIGFGLAFSALFSKLWRVNRLLAAGATFKRIEVTTRDVMLPLVVLTGLNILVLTLWTIMDPLYWVRESLDSDRFGRVKESAGSCKSDNMGVFVVPILAINGAALVLALWQAYVGRNITTDLNEASYIAMATVCIFQALFMGTPVIFIVEDQRNTYVFIYSMVVSIICFAILLLIFVPKFMAMRKGYNPTRSTVTNFSVNGGTRISGLGSPPKSSVRVSMSGDLAVLPESMFNQTSLTESALDQPGESGCMHASGSGNAGDDPV